MEESGRSAAAGVFRRRKLLGGKPNLHKINAVRTSKYTIWNYLPQVLLFQFSRFSNLYFLAVGLLQILPVTSDSNGLPTTWLPLSIVIVVSSVKDLLEDLKRHRSDREENNHVTHVCRYGGVEARRWGDVRLGDLVVVRCNENVPADLALLNCSGDFGVCYLETKSLDGETNLKHKTAIPGIAEIFVDPETAGKYTAVAECGEPSEKLYEFSGVLRGVSPAPVSTGPPPSKINNKTNNNNSTGIPSVPILKGPVPLTFSQFIHRGTSLVNTEWLIGLVVFVSTDTRIFRNGNTKAKNKWSHLEKTYNRHVLLLLLMEAIFCIIVVIGALLKDMSHVWYLEPKGAISSDIYVYNGESVWETMLIVLGRMSILFAYFVPLDLVLQLEIVRFIQAVFVSWDSDLVKDGRNAGSQSSHLLEELGNISHVYTDKTGTLTLNKMVMRAVAIPGTQILGSNPQGHSFASLVSQQSDEFLLGGMPTQHSSSSSGAGFKIESYAWGSTLPYHIHLTNNNAALSSKDFTDLLDAATPSQQAQLRGLALSMALCHTVLVKPENKVPVAAPVLEYVNPPLEEWLGQGVKLELVILRIKEDTADVDWPSIAQFDASSPDELAFVSQAQVLGMDFNRRPNLSSLQIRLLTPLARRLWYGNNAEATEKTLAKQEGPDITALVSKLTINGQLVAAGKGERFHGIWVPVVTVPLLHVLEFDNDRKMMSVIVRDLWRYEVPTVVVYTKGADSSILAKCSDASSALVIPAVKLLAEQGLRTLCFAQRRMEDEDYEAVHIRLVETQAREVRGENKGEAEAVMADIENHLKILGSTGIEDRLQPGVPQVIEELRSIGIKIWVLTGDKPETAINIAYSTNLLTPHAAVPIITAESRRELAAYLEDVYRHCENHGLLRNSQPPPVPTPNVTIAVRRKAQSLRQQLKAVPAGQTVVMSLEPEEKTNIFKRAVSALKLRTQAFNKWCENSGVSRADSEDYFNRCVGGELSEGNEVLFGGLDDMRSPGLISFEQRESSCGNGSPLEKGTQPPKFNPTTAQSVVLLKEGGHAVPIAPFVAMINKRAGGGCKEFLTQEGTPPAEFSLVVTGAALDKILTNRQLLVTFYRLARYATTVIACRVSPKQKSLLVAQSAAINPECCSTLAIGDGANDVPMILAANVGVGVSGKEGLQATRAADFAIPEFQALRKLLFVHGREALRRNTFLVYYGIFKNISFAFGSYAFQQFNGFSGQDIYNVWLKAIYSTLFVAPAIIVYCIFDRELPHGILARSPITYRCYCPVMWPLAVSQKFTRVCGFLSRLLSCQCCCRRRPQPLQNASRCRRFFTRITNFGRTVPRGTQAYGTKMFAAWVLYAVVVGWTVTTLPLYTLKYAVIVDSVTTNLNVTSPFLQFSASSLVSRRLLQDANMVRASDLLSSESLPKWNPYVYRRLKASTTTVAYDTGKTGLDLSVMSMVVMLQCVVVSNLIVLLAINSLFWFQIGVFLLILVLFMVIWLLTSAAWLSNRVVALRAISGTLSLIQSCPVFYFCVVLSCFICIVLPFSAKAFKVMLQPPPVAVIKERMLRGVFDVVVGRTAEGFLVVLAPLRQPAEKELLDRAQKEKEYEETTAADILPQEEAAAAFEQRGRRASLQKRFPDHPKPYAALQDGFAFAYDDTVVSGAPSVWTLTSVAQWATRQVAPQLQAVGHAIRGAVKQSRKPVL